MHFDPKNRSEKINLRRRFNTLNDDKVTIKSSQIAKDDLCFNSRTQARVDACVIGRFNGVWISLSSSNLCCFPFASCKEPQREKTYGGFGNKHSPEDA
jgi:hypothetical protein